MTLSHDASEAAVLNQLDTLLAAYGGANAYGRELQPSHRFLENELVQLRTMALVPPAIFLLVTVFLIQVVMSRHIAIQREQIAMMRAFGYQPGELVLHYLSFAIVIGLMGVAIGTMIGAKLGSDLTVLYTRFFRFPVMDYQLDWRLVLVTSSVRCVQSLLVSGAPFGERPRYLPRRPCSQKRRLAIGRVLLNALDCNRSYHKRPVSLCDIWNAGQFVRHFLPSELRCLWPF